MPSVQVSILCAAYNHEPYIRDALEGFVRQKTDFPYEVIINDDASGDNTAAVIREYEQKYPDIIKPIYQTENQYYHVVSMVTDILLPHAAGKYLALCEGDDYWIDENKLQMQYDYMEAHPDCTFAFTDAKVVGCRSKTVKDFFRDICGLSPSAMEALSVDGKIDLEHYLRIYWAPTASCFFPRSNFDRFPESFNEPCPGFDKKNELYSVWLGYAHYFPQQTCVYRKEVPNSATAQWAKSSRKETYRRNLSFLRLYDNINRLTDFRYSELIFERVRSVRVAALLTGVNRRLLKDPDCQRVVREADSFLRLKIRLANAAPPLFRLLQRLRHAGKKPS